MRARGFWCVITSIISPPPRNGGMSSSTSCLQGEQYFLNTYSGASCLRLCAAQPLALMQPLSSIMMLVAELPAKHEKHQDLHRAGYSDRSDA